MTMTIDTNQQRFPLNFDHMSSYSPHHPPQFTNPWVSSSPTTSNPQAATSQSMYMNGGQSSMHHASLGLESLKQQQPQSQHHTQQPQQQHSPSQPQHSPSHHQLHLPQPHHQQQRPPAQQPLPPAPSSAPQLHRTGNLPSSSMAQYGAMTVTAGGGPPSTSPHNRAAGVPDPVYVGQRGDLLSALPAQDMLSLGRLAPPQQQTTTTTAATSYADPATAYTAPSPIHPAYATSSTPYDQMGYAPAPMRSTFIPESSDRRYSQSGSIQGDDRRSFADAIEASHGILSLSQDTPRPIYGTGGGAAGAGAPGGRSRGSGDSYGFPSAHSTSSSVSSSSFNGFYGGGSIDSSVSDYSTAGSDIESVASRTLPMPRAPNFLTTNPAAAAPMSSSAPSSQQIPPAPQSMMSQFSSKMTSTAQKKHKCKVCDKRFTRPSSLQTHMYSHTGEKPFCCEVEGCGRHFSVVSNLRRHRKVHKDQAPSETGSEDHHSE